MNDANEQPQIAMIIIDVVWDTGSVIWKMDFRPPSNESIYCWNGARTGFVKHDKGLYHEL